MRVEAGDSQPSSDEADSGDGVDSGSGSSLESIIVHDLEEDHPTPSDMGDRMESLSIAEAQKPTLAPAPLSLGIGSTSPPSQPALIPFEPYNPRVAGYAAYPYGIDNGYSFGADLPLGMNPDAYNYPSGYHTQTHTRYPSFSSDYPQTHLLPRSPSFYHSNSLYPTADPGANAPLSWNHDCPPHSSHGSYTSNALHFIPYQQRQAIFYPSTAPGMTTPPSPPDHLQLPRRPSDASDASSYGRSQNIYVGHAPWEQYQAPMAPAVSAAVVQQLQTGGVMRRQGVTKFFDQQKVRSWIPSGSEQS